MMQKPVAKSPVLNTVGLQRPVLTKATTFGSMQNTVRRRSDQLDGAAVRSFCGTPSQKKVNVEGLTAQYERCYS